MWYKDIMKGNALMEWLLEIYVGHQLLRQCVLDRNDLCLGRSPECNLYLPTHVISRYHAHLTVTPRYILIEDLGSTNGIFVNDRRVDRFMLGSGDAFTIGPYRFLLVLGIHPDTIPTLTESTRILKSSDQSLDVSGDSIANNLQETIDLLEEALDQDPKDPDDPDRHDG